ncbi:cell division cycle 20 cdc20 fizzy -related [Anaeramoeba ignava]|uniref:Cell division cycle 20 cdc20 fizzy -related n=1 Tax=Anaeramoeba ignava TaxID=1746090 RepID=A0A9Q0R663_ANAIG|nr:cell division cycle 20 cdc20 fizzy -related [Anaeramoeba ignava]
MNQKIFDDLFRFDTPLNPKNLRRVSSFNENRKKTPIQNRKGNSNKNGEPKTPIFSNKKNRNENKNNLRNSNSRSRSRTKTRSTSKSRSKSNQKSNSKSNSKKTPRCDRFIPTRNEDLNISNFHLTNEETISNIQEEDTPKKIQYKNALTTSLLMNENFNTNQSNFSQSKKKEEQDPHFSNLENSNQKDYKILRFKDKAPPPSPGIQQSNILYSQNKFDSKKKSRTSRVIPQVPERILDAPDFVDDYYLNLLDWGSDSILAVALGPSVYLWNSKDAQVSELFEPDESEEDETITAVSWIQSGNVIALGKTDGCVELWDCEKQMKIRSMDGHLARVGALSWNSHILSSGSRDTAIFHHDVRIAQHKTAVLKGHSQEVCGLKWSPDGNQLASGGNDNILNIWNAHSHTSPEFILREHTAAVKAIDWCPWQRYLLATGGGTADAKIKFWNTQNGNCLNTIDSGSQVCALKWSTTHREFVSSHGFSQFQLSVWKYPSLTKITDLTGHTSRVLQLALSPDGSTVCSVAGDETLRFWKIFSSNDSLKSNSLISEKKFKQISNQNLSNHKKGTIEYFNIR